MANYSYTAGMENRGLEWIWIPMTPNAAPKAGVLSNYMKALQSAIGAFYASVPISNAAAQQIVILENYVVPSGTGSFFNVIFFYNPTDPRRLTGDNIRFHNGGQDLPVKPLL